MLIPWMLRREKKSDLLHTIAGQSARWLSVPQSDQPIPEDGADEVFVLHS